MTTPTAQLTLFEPPHPPAEPSRDGGPQETHPSDVGSLESGPADARSPDAESADAGTPTESSASPSERIRRALAERLSAPIASLVFTQNRSRILSARPSEAGALAVRLHRAFQTADAATLDAVATLIDGASDPQALDLARGHVETHRRTTGDRPRRRLRPRGDVHDLDRLLARVEATYFPAPLSLAITWGRWPNGRRLGRRRSASIRLGSYVDSERLIVIHPVLDRVEVPEFVVEVVVHHEALHAVVPPRATAGRRRLIHPPEFRRREREHPRCAEANRWIETHFDRLDAARRQRR
ncbi:MAG: hypothetical protein AAGN46_14525 [Acidobacteriota bacterium]